MKNLFATVKFSVWLFIFLVSCQDVLDSLKFMRYIESQIPSLTDQIRPIIVGAAYKSSRHLFTVSILFLFYWILVLPLVMITDIYRWSKSGFFSKVSCRVQWKRYLLDVPPALTVWQLPLFLVIRFLGVQEIWFVPIFLILHMIVFTRVMSGKEPDPKEPPK